MQQELFIKVLGMTTSTHDGEALAAIRKANELLKAAGVTWREYIEAVDITRKAKGGKQAPPPPPPQDDFEDIEVDEIREMLDVLLRTVSPQSPFRNFIESVNQQFCDNGHLSEKQIAAIRKSYKRQQGHF
jgi:hypothetical protein